MGTSRCTTLATSTVGTGTAGALAPFVHPWKKRMLARPITTNSALRLAKASVEKAVESAIGTLLKQSCWYLRSNLTRALLRCGLEGEHLFRCAGWQMSQNNASQTLWDQVSATFAERQSGRVTRCSVFGLTRKVTNHLPRSG